MTESARKAELLDLAYAYALAHGLGDLSLRPLAAARRIYLDRGFTLTATEPHHSFGHDLVGQTYELQL